MLDGDDYHALMIARAENCRPWCNHRVGEWKNRWLQIQPCSIGAWSIGFDRWVEGHGWGSLRIRRLRLMKQNQHWTVPRKCSRLTWNQNSSQIFWNLMASKLLNVGLLLIRCMLHLAKTFYLEKLQRQILEWKRWDSYEIQKGMWSTLSGVRVSNQVPFYLLAFSHWGKKWNNWKKCEQKESLNVAQLEPSNTNYYILNCHSHLRRWRFETRNGDRYNEGVDRADSLMSSEGFQAILMNLVGDADGSIPYIFRILNIQWQTLLLQQWRNTLDLLDLPRWWWV